MCFFILLSLRCVLPSSQLPISLSICKSVHLSTCMCIHLYVWPPVYPFVCLSVCFCDCFPSVIITVCLYVTVSLSLYVCVCLSVFMFVVSLSYCFHGFQFFLSIEQSFCFLFMCLYVSFCLPASVPARISIYLCIDCSVNLFVCHFKCFICFSIYEVN